MAAPTDSKNENALEPRFGSALVVGAGVAGIRAALDLAEVGYRVLLTEASPAIGGILAKLDYQFPTDHCGMCKMLPVVGREYASQHCMRKSLFHDNIKIMPFTELVSVEGEPGAFRVALREHARHVDTDLCVGTARCTDVCPIEVPDEFNQGLTRRKAIFRPVPHNLPNMYVIDMKACNRCGECVKICPTGAIDLDAEDKLHEVEVDTIILAAGAGIYQPGTPGDLSSYRASPDVVTSLEFERLLSASGRYDGRIHRPSDGRPAQRIAWMQCVGSRNCAQGRDYCSSICCMFALKEAILAHEKGGPGMESTIFYMDLRTYGKDFQRYREQAEDRHGVRLIRCRVHNVNRLGDGSLEVRYPDPKSGEWRNERFDLVVLSTGQSPPAGTARLAETLGVALPPSGFFPTEGISRVASPRDGVYLCGSFTGLSDIGDSVVSGSAAASAASQRMAVLGRPFKEQDALGPERAVERQRPRVHVLLCRWNGLDLDALRPALQTEPGVGEVQVVERICRGEGLEAAGAALGTSTCNRVLIGACLPFIYRKRLKDLAQRAGFNAALTEIVDLRGAAQRAEDDASALEAVRRQILTGVRKLEAAEPVQSHVVAMTPRALVLGGGLTGMRAALSLARRGVEVALCERSGELGGRTGAGLRHTLEGIDPVELAREMREAVREQGRITVYTGAEVISSHGSLGHFVTGLRQGKIELTVEHGATIIATGAREATTGEYGHGASDRVLTQFELEERLASGSLDVAALSSVVMIQCVGSREEGGRRYCSRVCCPAALKNAFKIRERNPETRIVVLYRDLMTPGFLEEHYTRARRDGILFASYELDAKPQLTLEDGKPTVTFVDPILHQPVKVSADLVCLGTGIEPEPGNARLAEVLGVPLTEDGFFQEAESKWRPVDFLKEGVFVAGLAHSPRPLVEALTQAEAAAQRAFTYLSQRQFRTARTVSSVHISLCSRCQTCVTVCPFDARAYDEAEGRIVVDEAACQGCGMCAVACPNGAAEVGGSSQRQALALVEASLQPRAWPR